MPAGGGYLVPEEIMPATNKLEKIIEASIAIAAKREERARVDGEVNELLEEFKRLTRTSKVRVTATDASQSEPERRQPSRTPSKIMRVLKGGVPVEISKIIARCKVSHSSVYLALSKLMEDGLVEKASLGSYVKKK